MENTAFVCVARRDGYGRYVTSVTENMIHVGRGAALMMAVEMQVYPADG